MITKVKYTDIHKLTIQITFSDGSVFNQPTDANSVHRAELDEWLTLNNIEVYKTDEELHAEYIERERYNINKWRDEQFELMTVSYPKGDDIHIFDMNAKGRSEINGTVTNILLSRLAGFPDQPITWTTANDEDVEFTFDDIITIAQLTVREYNRIHQEARARKLAL